MFILWKVYSVVLSGLRDDVDGLHAERNRVNGC